MNRSKLGMGGAIALLVLVDCDSNERTEFPAGVAPLADTNAAPLPVGTDADPFPEQLDAVGGEGDFNWVHAQGYVHAPIEKTWEAIRSPEASRDHTQPDWRVQYDVETGYDYSYMIHYTVHDILTVEFEVSFRFSAVEGTKEKPDVIAGRYRKTWGTTFIRLLDGSIVARKVDDRTTQIEMIEHLDATNTGTSSVEKYLREYYGNIVQYVHAGEVH